MAKNKKKRNKRYTGADSAQTSVRITKVSVPDRSRLSQYFHENRRRFTVYGVAAAIMVALYAIISFVVSFIF